MSQTTATTPPGRGGAPATVPVLPGQVGGGSPQNATLAVPDLAKVGSSVTHVFSGSPGRLRIAAGVSALACLLFAVAGGFAMQYRANALEDARSHAAQVVRVQKATADLVRADAAVSNGFLTGGAEPAAQTAEYDAAIASASRLLVDAAAAEPTDRVELAQANQLLADYSRQIASARAANRAGQPLGSGYLVIASQTILRGQLLPLLDKTVTANSDAVDSAFGRADTAYLLGAAGIGPALVVMGGVQLWLARRTHRFVNLGLAGASVALLAGTVWSVSALSSSSSVVSNVRDTSYTATRALATARADAYSAKGLESLTLVKQGGGAAYEKQWGERAAAVDTALESAKGSGVNVAPMQKAFSDWRTLHVSIRELDDGGKWPQARDVAVATDGGSSNARFAAFVDTVDPVLDAQAAKVSSGLAEPWGSLQTAGWASIVLGVLAAIGSVAGISRRLREYR